MIKNEKLLLEKLEEKWMLTSQEEFKKLTDTLYNWIINRKPTLRKREDYSWK